MIQPLRLRFQADRTDISRPARTDDEAVIEAPALTIVFARILFLRQVPQNPFSCRTSRHVGVGPARAVSGIYYVSLKGLVPRLEAWCFADWVAGGSPLPPFRGLRQRASLWETEDFMVEGVRIIKLGYGRF